jgi:hypothetical protein
MTISPSSPSAGFDWDSPRFPSVDACVAIGCNTQWLTGLISASPVVYPLGRDEVVERVKRRMFLFKFRTVFHLALIKRLRAFLSLKDAADAANPVVHSDYLFAGDLSPNGGDVFLVVVALAPGDPHPVYSSVVVPGAYLGEVLGTSGGRSTSPRIVFNVTPVFDQVVEGLGL